MVTFEVLSIWCNTPIETFFHCSKQVLNSLILITFNASAIFLNLFFQLGEWENKVAQGEIGWTRRVRQRDHAIFDQKLLNTQHGTGRCAHISSIVKWANGLKEFPKDSLKLYTASHNNASWYTNTDGFLERLPIGVSRHVL